MEQVDVGIYCPFRHYHALFNILVMKVIRNAIDLWEASEKWASQCTWEELYECGVESRMEQIIVYAESIGINSDQIDWEGWEELEDRLDEE